MLDKTTHPFIVNTLDSSSSWSLEVRAYHDTWGVGVWFDDDGLMMPSAIADGPTLADALDNLERLLETGSAKA